MDNLTALKRVLAELAGSRATYFVRLLAVL